MTQPRHYLVNNLGFALLVNGHIDTNKLSDVHVCQSADHMYEKAAELQGVTIDETRGYSQIINAQDFSSVENFWFEIDHAGREIPLEIAVKDTTGEIEKHISEWEQ
ncbi:hypothetical protein [Vibrio barjaei]|uniref:hypothetical protein n=1 Tax=Vibrio barjaei TaxID=1676683 RepID=UPI00228453F8|nr:hypothetical protein [Vibrio barjaei]MCY9874060.1 hypothetical protein [Vibrio barjaei]